NAARVWRDILQATIVFIGAFTALGVISWGIRTVIDHRRWLRTSKLQAEVHSKVMDRLTSNEELLAYIQTPAGRRFLESASIPADLGPRAINAPFSRILWSIQIGLVLAVGGIGLEIVSPRLANNAPEAANVFFVLGGLAIALGIGFVLS